NRSGAPGGAMAAAGPGGETPALSRVLPQGGRGGRADTAMPASTVRVSDGDPWHGLVPSGWGVPPYNSPMTTYPTVQLKNAWRSSHPWIFQKIVQKPATRPRPGEIVEAFDVDGQFIGRGFYNGHSRIALRILESDPAVHVDAGWFERRIG